MRKQSAFDFAQNRIDTMYIMLTIKIETHRYLQFCIPATALGTTLGRNNSCAFAKCKSTNRGRRARVCWSAREALWSP